MRSLFLLPLLALLAACAPEEESNDRGCTVMAAIPYVLTVNTSDAESRARHFDLVLDGVTGSCDYTPLPQGGFQGPCTFAQVSVASFKPGQYTLTWDWGQSVVPKQVDIRLDDGNRQKPGEYVRVTPEPQAVEINGPGCGVDQVAKDEITL